MKKINLVHFTPKNKETVYTVWQKYVIHLDNQRWLRYTTKKDLNFAMADINRQLNTLMFELNELWIASFAEYRRIWFYLPPLTYRSEEIKVKNCNTEIDRLMSLLTERSSWINGNTFSFKYLYLIIDYLTEQFGFYCKILTEKKHNLEVHVNQNRIITLRRIHESLKTLTVEPRYSPKKFS
jgi:hypothetical protein